MDKSFFSVQFIVIRCSQLCGMPTLKFAVSPNPEAESLLRHFLLPFWIYAFRSSSFDSCLSGSSSLSGVLLPLLAAF